MHADFLTAMGGPSKVAALLQIKNPNAVTNWRIRGVPLRYRNRLAKHARALKVPLPDKFLEPLKEFAA